MSELIPFPDGGFAFLAGGFPYSQGVRALDGYAIERARFARPLPVERGFTAIEAHLASIGRPRTALCAAELRSPKPFSMGGFKEFNQGYVAVLKQWGLFRDERNPVARSNVAPELDPPDEPSFYAFCYTVPAVGAAPSFVVAGSGEWPEGGKFPDDIVAHGDVSPAGLQAKARFVLGKMESRLAGLRRELAGCHGHAGLYGARHPRRAPRGHRPPRRQRRRADLAPVPSAHRRAGVRDGCARGCGRAGARLVSLPATVCPLRRSVRDWIVPASDHAGAVAGFARPRLSHTSAAVPRMPFGMKMMNSTSSRP